MADYHLRCSDCVRGNALILETSRRRPYGPLSIPEICYHSSSFSLKRHYFLQSAGNNVPFLLMATIHLVHLLFSVRSSVQLPFYKEEYQITVAKSAPALSDVFS